MRPPERELAQPEPGFYFEAEDTGARPRSMLTVRAVRSIAADIERRKEPQQR